MSQEEREYEYPIDSKLPRLPLNGNGFSWESFQTFCEELISKFPEMKECHRYGGIGSKQYGIDIISESQNGEKWAFSCKQYKTFNKNNAKKVLDETTYLADHYILLLSCDASTMVRETITGKSKWDVWDVQDISRKVRDLPLDKAKGLVETHFGKYIRSQFLAFSNSPFVKSEEFFKPQMDSKKLFNHNWRLIGRNEYLECFDTFVKDDNLQVAILSGHGGMGKTKILYSFAEDFDKKYKDNHLRFLLEGSSLNLDDFDSLPQNNCIIVVDDAHRRDNNDLKNLLNLSNKKRIKLVLSLRSYALERIRSLLTIIGFDIREIYYLKNLSNLKRNEMIEIARQALGKEYEHISEKLIAVTGDNPLITVIGGRLIAEKAIPPALLECDKDFRYTALEKFEEFLLGNIDESIDQKICKNILSLISSISPINLNNQDILTNIEQFLKLERNELIDCIAILEESGVLLIRGYSLKITPDVLSDYILHRACIARNGQITNYSTIIFRTFGSICPEKVLKNLAELDWRINASSEQKCDLIGDIWRKIESEYMNSSDTKRFQILNYIKEISYYQPKRVLDLIEYTIVNPSEINDEEKHEGTYIRHNHEDILHLFPKLIKDISYTIDYIPQCLNILWEIGRDERGSSNAIETLIWIASYDIDKPIIFQEKILSAIKEWQKSPNAHDYWHSSLEIIDPLLAKEGNSHHVRDRSEFVYRTFVINIESVQHIRKQALNILRECANIPKTKAVLRAIESLENVLRTVRENESKKDIEKEQEKWLFEQLDVIEIIKDLVIKKPNSLICLWIINNLRWHRKHHPVLKIKEKIKEILDLIPNSFELRLMQALYNSYYVEILDEEDLSHNKRIQREEEINTALAKDFCKIYSDVNMGVNKLNECFELFKNSNISINPNQFLLSISRVNPGYALKACYLVVEEPSSPLASYFEWMLYGIRDVYLYEGLDIAKRAVKSKKCVFSLAVARMYNRRWAKEPLSDDIDLIRELLIYPNLEVRQNAIGSLGGIFLSNKEAAMNIFNKIYIYDNVLLAEELLKLLNDNYGIPYDILNHQQLESLLKKLEPVKDIDKYYIQRFINYLSKRSPNLLIQFLVKRVEYENRVNSHINWDNINNWINKYNSIPLDGLHDDLVSLVECDDYKDNLRHLRDIMIADNDQMRSLISELFAEVSIGFNQDSLEVLDEWVNSKNKIKINMIGEILKRAPPDFVFNHIDFVANLLNCAYNSGYDIYNCISNNLLYACISGGSIILPGEPNPKYTKLSDQANKILENMSLGSPEYRFYSELRDTANNRINHDLKIDEDIFD